MASLAGLQNTKGSGPGSQACGGGPGIARAPLDAPRELRAGIGLKPAHYASVLAAPHAVGFVEVHAENYMGDGGAPHAALARIRAELPLSVHGVGLSLGGSDALDTAHLARLQRLLDRYEPALFSEHLAWSSHGGQQFNDLLPLAYTRESLHRTCDHIDVAQAYLGRQLLLENPSTYVAFAETDIDEADFLASIVARTGCGLLLDLNNAYVSCHNHGWDVQAYLAALPLNAVGELHVAGFSEDCAANGERLLIDTHGSEVAGPVWDLLAWIRGEGVRAPVLVEWDNDVPAFEVLARQASMANTLDRVRAREPRHAVP